MFVFTTIFQVPVLSILFLIVSLGNIITTVMVIPQKLQEKVKLRERIGRIRRFLHGDNFEPKEPEVVNLLREEKSTSTPKLTDDEKKTS